jgi:hypothetical protein
MQDKARMTTMIRILAQLQKEGYTTDFAITEDDNRLISSDGRESFTPQQVKIVNFYRFEGESYPGDTAILYVLETDTGLKGTLTDAYGIYSDERTDNFLRQVESLGKDLNRHSK